jgi:N-acetylglutamate synthase-like GNAT family acetyltransferase
LIRRATVDDAPVVSALVKRAYASWVPIIGRRPRPMDEDYAETFAAAEFEAWVKTDGDLIRGLLILQPEPDHLWVDNVAVDPVAAGTGIATELLDHAAKRAIELDLPETWLFTHEKMQVNREIYLHLGWTQFVPEDPIGDNFVYFRKPVGEAGA